VVPLDYKAVLSEEGLGGTYFIYDGNGVPLFVFKPDDEEPGCVNNPKNNFDAVKSGVKPGDGAKKECVAFLLDKDNFAKVPKTSFIELENFVTSSSNKKGSIQQYIENIGNVSEMSPSLFSIENVQRIAQLDIRLFNMDRNCENMIIRETDNGHELVPIDHSYILPENINDGVWFDWMHWKQVKQPICPSVLKYIEEIDIEKDAETLRKIGINEDSITTMKLATLVLKRGSIIGWTLNQIANFLSRPIKGNDKRSELEKQVETIKNTSNNSKEDSFWEKFNELLNRTIL